jgi:hypothetical protein
MRNRKAGAVAAAVRAQCLRSAEYVGHRADDLRAVQAALSEQMSEQGSFGGMGDAVVDGTHGVARYGRGVKRNVGGGEGGSITHTPARRRSPVRDALAGMDERSV